MVQWTIQARVHIHLVSTGRSAGTTDWFNGLSEWVCILIFDHMLHLQALLTNSKRRYPRFDQTPRWYPLTAAAYSWNNHQFYWLNNWQLRFETFYQCTVTSIYTNIHLDPGLCKSAANWFEDIKETSIYGLIGSIARFTRKFILKYSSEYERAVWSPSSPYSHV